MPATSTLSAPLMSTPFCAAAPLTPFESITTLRGFALFPISRRYAFLPPLIFTPSWYVPAAILIVSPFAAAFTAFWIVLKQPLPCLHPFSVCVWVGRLPGLPGSVGGG